MTTSTRARPLFDPPIVRQAMLDALRKLDPRIQVRNPVMFVVLVGSIFTSLLFLQALFGTGEAPTWFILAISLWLWFTVLFANFAEAMAEGRGKAQADSLRRARTELTAKKFGKPTSGGDYLAAPAALGKPGEVVLFWFRPVCSRRATSSLSRPAILFPPMGKSSKESPPSTKARLRARARR